MDLLLIPVLPLCRLCVLCASVVDLPGDHHRDTEITENAQRFQTAAGQRFPQLASLTPKTAAASVRRICAVFTNKLFGVKSSRQVQIFGDETRLRLLFVFNPAVSQMIAALRVILATLFAVPAKAGAGIFQS